MCNLVTRITMPDYTADLQTKLLKYKKKNLKQQICYNTSSVSTNASAGESQFATTEGNPNLRAFSASGGIDSGDL